MNHISTHNDFNLGDNIFHLDYLMKIINNHPDYIFTHYCREVYHSQLYKLIVGYENSIYLKPLIDVPDYSINSWIGHGGWYHNIWCGTICEYPSKYDYMYIEWYTHLEKTYGLPNPRKTPTDFLLYFKDIENYDLPKSYDVLVINSIPLSGQYSYEHELFVKFCNMMSSNNLSVITTNKLENYECTLEYDYDVTQIAKISTKAKYILAINTGPIALCINKYTMSNCQFFHVLDDANSYSYDIFSWSRTLREVEFSF